LPQLLVRHPQDTPSSTLTQDRRRGRDRRRTLHERRQLLLKQVPDDDRRSAAFDRRGGRDRRMRAPNVAAPRRPTLPAPLAHATRLQRLGTRIDVYA
jgi:hypothetical protein